MVADPRRADQWQHSQAAFAQQLTSREAMPPPPRQPAQGFGFGQPEAQGFTFGQPPPQGFGGFTFGRGFGGKTKNKKVNKKRTKRRKLFK